MVFNITFPTPPTLTYIYMRCVSHGVKEGNNMHIREHADERIQEGQLLGELRTICLVQDWMFSVHSSPSQIVSDPLNNSTQSADSDCFGFVFTGLTPIIILPLARSRLLQMTLVLLNWKYS